MKKMKVLICPQEGCGRRFIWLTHYKYHLRNHSGIKPYACETADCGRSFNTRQILNVHQRTHSGEKPFLCSEEGCGKNFNTAGNLKNHMRTHSGERPFACSRADCERRFAEASSLKKHLLVHSGEKPYSCDLCGKLFSQISSRNVHVRRHYIRKDKLDTEYKHEKQKHDRNEEKAKIVGENSSETFNLQVVFPSNCIAMPTTTASHSTPNVLVLAEPQQVMMISSMCLQTDNIGHVVCGAELALEVDEQIDLTKSEESDINPEASTVNGSNSEIMVTIKE